jgi:sugar phosphate isomerase/epimerase
VQLDPYHVPGLHGKELRILKEHIDSYHFDVILGSVISIANEDKDAEKALAEYIDYLDACRELNVSIMRGVPGGDRFMKAWPMDEQIKTICENGKRLGKLAEDAGVTIAFENHGTLQARELVAIVDGIGSDHVRINLDNGNSLLAFEDPVDAFTTMAPLTVSLHFKDFRRQQTTYGMIVDGCPLGEGCIDLDAQLDIFKQTCPDAALCLEICLSKGDEEIAVKKSLDWLRRRVA